MNALIILQVLKQRLINYHLTVLEKIQANQSSPNNNNGHNGNNNASANNNNNNGKGPGSGGKSGKPSDLEVFTGFKPAIIGCFLDWDSCPIPGVTYGHNSHYLAPFAVFKLDPVKSDEQSSQVNSSQAVLRCEYPHRPRSRDQVIAAMVVNDGDALEDRANERLSEVREFDEVKTSGMSKNGNAEKLPLMRMSSQDSNCSVSGGPENMDKAGARASSQEIGLADSGPGSFTSTGSSSGAGGGASAKSGSDDGSCRGSLGHGQKSEGEPSKFRSSETESGNESAPEQLSRENSATDFPHSIPNHRQPLHGQMGRKDLGPSTGSLQQQKGNSQNLAAAAAENQYQVYFYDPKESSASSTTTGNNGAVSTVVPNEVEMKPTSSCEVLAGCKNGDVRGSIVIG